MSDKEKKTKNITASLEKEEKYEKKTIWFTKEPHKNHFELHISEEGIVFLNDAALQVMPAYINLGFNTESKQLYIKKSTSKHGFLVQNFPKKIYQLTDLLKEKRIPFPVCYHLVQPDIYKPFWVGTEYRKDRLSPLEKKVFQLTIKGHTETDIIKQLSLSEQYYNYIMEKIEALYYKK